METTHGDKTATYEAMNNTLKQRVLATFMGAFDNPPSTLAQAPGRVNLIGEHTDYNDGFVLPCAIDFQTLVAARARSDAVVRVAAADFGHAVDEFRVDAPIAPNPRLPWANYVRGVFEVFRQRGLPLQGAQIAIAGDVPQGAGLSSSAALEVAVATALRALNGWHDLSTTDLALAAQQAENRFVGCQCGIMDQLIAASGQAQHALLIDCRSLAATPVPLPEGVAVMIVHSNVQRGLVDSAYNLRRQQCQAAAQGLGVPSLRDATLTQLQAAQGAMDELAWRRARHVITENARTQQAAVALAAGDLHTIGQLMAESHRSMRDDFEITVPAVDQLVGILQQALADQRAEGGARMTGGGFGGCVVALLPEAHVDAVSSAVQRNYRSPERQRGTVFVTRAASGAGLLPG